MTQQNDFIEKNTQRVMEYITHDILQDLYVRNKDNVDNQELVNKIQAKYKDLYKRDINSQRSPSMAFVVKDDADLGKVYMDKVKEVCNDLGVNVQIDPKEVTNEKDYIIITERINEKVLSSVNKNVGVTTLLRPTSDSSTLAMDVMSLLNSKQVINNVVMSEEEFMIQLQSSAMRSRFQTMFVPDAPKLAWVKAINNIKNVREELAYSGGVVRKINKPID